MGDWIVDEAVRVAPAPALRRLVAWYSGYRQRGVPVARHRGLPSPWLTLILTLDEPLSVAAHPDPADAPGEYATLLGGLHLAPAHIEIPGRQSGIQLAISPLGARVLLGLPAGELAGARAELYNLAGEKVAESTDWNNSGIVWLGYDGRSSGVYVVSLRGRLLSGAPYRQTLKAAILR